MKLNLNFYRNNSNLILPGQGEADKGKIVFDEVNDRIGADGYWFGSQKLPLSGGTLSGPIKFSNNANNVNNSAIILGGKSIIVDNGHTSDGSTRYLFNYENSNSVALGNYKMYGLFKSWNSNLEHWVSSNNSDTGTISKYNILDTKNTSISNYQNNNINYGYTLKLPSTSGAGSNSYNILGYGNLHPAISIDTNGQIKISVGGEESSSAPIYASTLVGNNYFDYDSSSKKIYHIIGNNASDPIEIGDGLKIEKIVHIDPNTNKEYTGGNANRPGNFHYKISIADEIISRIEALEARNTISFDNI